MAEEADRGLLTSPFRVSLGGPLFWWANSGSLQPVHLASGHTSVFSAYLAPVVQAPDIVPLAGETLL